MIKKRYLAFAYLIFSTAVHPAAGIQLFLIFSLISIYDYLFSGDKTVIDFLYPILIYLFTAGIYIFLLLIKVDSADLSDNTFLDIFEFRNAHHFFPQYFPLKSYLIEIVLYLTGIYIMIKYRYFTLLKISFVILIGTVFYTFGVLFIESAFILSTQWFKSTVWLELISLISVLTLIDMKSEKILKYINKIALPGLYLFIVISLILIVAKFQYFQDKPYSFYYGCGLNPEEALGVEVKKMTDRDAVFIYPIEFTGFKFYSERSAFVEFKSFVHRKDALNEWYRRIKLVYGIDVKDRRNNENIFDIANLNYMNCSVEKFNKFREMGIDYMVQTTAVKLDLPIIYRNQKFIVYKL